jgi:hypothetical protein
MFPGHWHVLIIPPMGKRCKYPTNIHPQQKKKNKTLPKTKMFGSPELIQYCEN